MDYPFSIAYCAVNERCGRKKAASIDLFCKEYQLVIVLSWVRFPRNVLFFHHLFSHAYQAQLSAR